MKRKILICIITIITFFAFACANPEPDTKPGPMQNYQARLAGFDISDSAELTYCVIGFFPAEYDIYVFSQGSFYHYDYTEYWLSSDDGFDYFNDTIPTDSKYLIAQGSVPEETWNALKKALKDNKINNLSDDMDVNGIDDGGIYEIEVIDGTNRFFAGGYMAGQGKGDNHKRFYNIQLAFSEAIKECEDALENEKANNNPIEDSYNNIFVDDPEDENIFDYYSSTDGSLFIRQDLNTQSSYINDHGRWIQIDIATGAYGPRIEKFDVDGDGVEEYVIAECEGTETGFSVYGLIIYEDDGNKATSYKYDYSYFVNMIDESIDYNYNENTHELDVHEKLPPYYDRYEGCSVTLDSNLTFEKIVYTDIINISIENDRIYMSAPIGCVYSEYMAPDYDNAILVKAELIFNEDMTFYPIWYITANE